MHSGVLLLQDFLIHSAQLWPDRIALVCDTRHVSYGELGGQACRFSRALRRQGVERGDRVLIFTNNSIETVVAFWGALIAGAVAVPISPETKADKLAWLLEDCAASVMVASARLAPVFTAAAGQTSSLKAVLVADSADSIAGLPCAIGFDEALNAELDQTESDGTAPAPCLDIDLAALVYTSGSRGEPKGVMLTHRNMQAAAASLCQYLELRGDDVILCLLPLSFDYGLYQMIMSIRQGARLVLERSVTLPAEIMKRVAAERVTVFPGVPTIFALLTQVRDPSLWDRSSVRTVTNTAAALPSRHINLLRSLFPDARIFSMYGLTECKRCTYLPPEDLARKPDSVGIAIPNTELWLVDERDNRLGPNQVGQLVIRGATVMQGYWGKPEETARALRPGLLPGERVLYTGDLCRLDEEGYLYFVGRMDDIIKSRGEKVAPVEVEAALLAVPGVKEAAVIGVPDPVLGQAVKAFVVPDDGAELDEAELRNACRQHLEGFKVPRWIVVIPSLPRTASGKVHKTGLA